MNRKGFTLIELLGVVVVLGLIGGIAVTSYNHYLKSSQDKSFQLEIDNFKSAAYNAYLEYLSGKDISLKDSFNELDINGETTITLKNLIDYNYIKKIKNPYNTGEICDLENSYVIIKNLDTTNLNKNLEYKTCLICGNYPSDECF